MSDGLSTEALAASLFKTTQGVLSNGRNSEPKPELQRGVVINHTEHAIGGINKVGSHLNNAKSLKDISLKISSGKLEEAGKDLTVLLATVLPSSPKFLNEVEETLNKLPQGKELLKRSKDYLANAKAVPYIGPILGMGTAIIPIAMGDFSRESFGNLGVAACRSGGGLAGPIGSETAAEFCADKLGDALHVKLEGSNTLNRIEDFTNFAKSETEKFKVKTVNSWEGIPSLQIPSVKRELSGRNLPTI